MTEWRVRLFRNGRNQVLTIPRELEFAGDEAILRKDGDRLVLAPVRGRSLLALLSTLAPLQAPFSDVDDDLSPFDDPPL